MESNTAELWDRAWQDPAVTEEFQRWKLAKEERGVRWRRIEALVRRDLGGFEGLRVVEIGCGTGTNAALMARRGAEVTLLDYSDEALARARREFERQGLPAKVVRADALNLPPELLGRFDLSMSFGTTEHFEGERRIAINKAHLDVLRSGGAAILSAPNAWCPTYRLWKLLYEKTGRWKHGLEAPYSRPELRRIMAALAIERYEFFGESFLESLVYASPLFLSRKLRRALGVDERYFADRMKRLSRRPWPATPLDPYLAYSLCVWARKP